MKKKLLMLLAVSVFLIGCGKADTLDTEEQKKEDGHKHEYVEEITTEAACETDGLKTFTCECGDSYTETIPATGHAFEEVADSTVPVTCDTDGKEADKKCSVCENSEEGAIIPAKGHSYGAYTYNNDATTAKDGTESATCSVCGGKTSRTKTGTKIPAPNFPYQLNVLYNDGKVGYFYCEYNEYVAAFGDGFHDTTIGKLCDGAADITTQNIIAYDPTIRLLDNNTFPYGYDRDVLVGHYAEGEIWKYTAYVRYTYEGSTEEYVWH